jgi:glycosyltransferase involved in cell wall biosynthesis
LFDEGVDALGFTPENRDDLVRTLVKLLTDSNLRERLGNAARETAIARFSPERFSQEAVDFFASIIRSNTK